MTPLRLVGVLVSLALLAFLTPAREGSAALAIDPWASGYALEGWDRIAALQRYPILVEKPPDWQAVSRDKDSLVRLAAAMAMARTPDAALIPHLRPLLMDEYPLVRCWALRALLEIRSPLIRDPLLEVIANWEDFATDADRGFEFYRVGLPYLTNRSLQDRRQWVKKSAPGWNMIIPAEPMHEWGAWYNIVACLKESEIDAGDGIVLRFTVGLASREESHSFELAGAFGSWRLIGADGRTTAQDLYDYRLQFPHDMGEPKRDKIELKTGPNGPFDLTVVTSRRPPPPDIYLFTTLNGATMLIRVRRSAEFEKTIPELLKAPLDAASAKTLGQQRVLAAVGPLMKAFAASGGSGPMGFAAAGALGRIGDPAAAPLLLDHPQLRNNDVCGDTSGALWALGEAVWPEYEKRILSWRSRLSGDEAYSLAMALRLLGPNGSEATGRARQEIISELTADLKCDGQGFEDPKFHILSAAISAIGPTQPDRVVEVIDELSSRPHLAAILLCEVDNKRYPPPVKERIVRGLRALLKTKVGDDPLRSALTPILVRIAPQVFAAEPGPIFNEEEALAAIEAVRHSSPFHKTYTRLRQKTCELVEDWLKTTPAPPRDMMRFRLALASLYLDSERYEDCLAILNVPQDQFKTESEHLHVAALRGRALMGLRRFDEAAASLQWAADHSNASTDYGDLSGSTIHRWSTELQWMPRRDDLRIRRVMMWGMEASDSHLRSLGLRVFGIDSGFILKSTDPLSGEVRVWATLPQEERGFIPLDEHRVFVARMDKTAALYEEGNAKPVWTRPFSLAPETYLSVGPTVITAAEEDGTLHAIDPATGKTLWTRKVQTSPWKAETWVNFDTPIQQAAGGVLIPDQKTPTQLEWVDAATGKELWTVRPDARLAAIAISKDLVVLGSGFGRVTALNRADGKPAWQADLVEKPPIGGLQAALAFDAAGGRLYAATDGQVWAIDAATGKTVWQWKWPERGAKVKPDWLYRPGIRLCPTEDGLVTTVGWDEKPLGQPSRYLHDIVRFAADGKVVLQETSPTEQHVYKAFVAGKRLVLDLGSSGWEVWEFLPAAP